MTTLTLQDLVTDSDDFDGEDLTFALRNPHQKFELLSEFGIDVIDWNVIGSDSGRQIGVLFDKGGKRYGYYRDNGETVLVKLDKDYQELADWGDSWDECPEVLSRD